MTPERRQEIRELLQSENPDTIARYGSNGIYQYGKDVRIAAMDLLADNDALTAENERLKGEVERLMANKWLFIPEEDVCKKCSGIGRRAYSSTATWRGGIGGQAITEDVCDSCWGTGRIDRKGFDIRKFGAEMKSLRAQLDALVTAGEKGIDAYCALCDVLSDLPTCIEDIVEDYQTHSDNIDALAAAVREAKGKE